MSDREILMDLVSYCPRLAGIADDTPQSAYANIIGEGCDDARDNHDDNVYNTYTVESVCVCVCVCVCDHMYACMCVCVSVITHLCMRVCGCVHFSLSFCVCGDFDLVCSVYHTLPVC